MTTDMSGVSSLAPASNPRLHYETWREGEKVDTSKILAATFTSGGKTYSGFRFDRNGRPLGQITQANGFAQLRQ